MRIGLLGVGHQGKKYIETFSSLGFPLAWASNRERYDADAVIIATPAQTHYRIAMTALSNGCHVLIEKPMVMDVDEARNIVALASRMGIVGFVGHTHLYSPAWRELKASAKNITEIRSISGGPCKTVSKWDWGSHDVAMRLDLGAECPHRMEITQERTNRRFEIVTDGGVLVYDDPPTTPRPMEVMVSEFVSACEKATPDISGLEMGRRVAEVLCA